MHRTYQQLWLAQIESAVRSIEAARTIRHRGIKGQIAELVAADILQPALPPHVAVCTGEIISHDGQTSSQQDIVIYDKNLVPPLLFDRRIGLIPIESVLVSIEVKTNLNMAGISKASIDAAKLHEMPITAGIYIDDKPKDHQTDRPVSSVLAYTSDIAMGSEIEILSSRVQNVTVRTNGTCTLHPAIKLVCIADRGCWVWRNGDWLFYNHMGNKPAALISFIASMQGLYESIRKSRGQPRFDAYIS